MCSAHILCRPILGGCIAHMRGFNFRQAQALEGDPEVPVVGALGGAAVNYAFIERFQDVARGHFTVRRLERLYGKDKIRMEYDRIVQQL
jgi:hypothetical protein